MAFARVVTFEGVNKQRMEEMDREMQEGQPPEGFPGTEIVVLHDPEAEKSLRDRLLRNGGRLQAWRRDAERDAGRGDPGAPHVGDEVRRRHSHDGLALRRKRS